MFCTRAGAGHFGPLVPFAKAFLRNNDEVVFVAPAESAVNAIETHRPDVVLWEASDFAAALAAETTGVPAVCIGITQAGRRRHRGARGSPPRAGPPARSHPRANGLGPLLHADAGGVRGPGGAWAAPRAPLPRADWWEHTGWPLVYLTLGSVAPTICHGESGTVRAGLAAGIPLAVLPLFADQPFNARRVTELGAGLTLDHASGAGDAVSRLLGEPAYGQAAQRVATATCRLPTVDRAVEIVRRLA